MFLPYVFSMVILIIWAKIKNLTFEICLDQELIWNQKLLTTWTNLSRLISSRNNFVISSCWFVLVKLHSLSVIVSIISFDTLRVIKSSKFPLQKTSGRSVITPILSASLLKIYKKIVLPLKFLLFWYQKWSGRSWESISLIF